MGLGNNNTGGGSGGGGGITNITNNNTILAADTAGIFRLGQRHEVATPVSLPTTITTGFNFTSILANHPDAILRLKITDDLNGVNRPWGYTDMDLGAVIEGAADPAIAQSGLVHVHTNAWVGLTIGDATQGEITFSENNRQLAYCSSEILAFSEVLETAESNYQDIGNTRIQWGAQAEDGVVILPVPFADTNYSVTTANSFTTAGRSSQILNNTKTTTQFEIRAFSGGQQSATGCNWQAIGVKP